MSKAAKRAKSGVPPVGGAKWEIGLSAANFEEVSGRTITAMTGAAI